MGRVVGAIVIFAVSIAACITEICVINYSICEIKQDIESIEELVQDKDIESALLQNEELEEKFKNKYTYISTFIDHERLEQIEDSITLMTVNLKNDSISDFFVESSKAISGLDNLNNTELPLIGNIL